MKEINCPIEKQKHKNYLRCINKDTLEYVDVPIARGLNCKIDLWPIVQNADKLSGRVNRFHKDEKKYDYACFVRINKDDNNLSPNQEVFIGFCLEEEKFYQLEIDIETNKILQKNYLPLVAGNEYEFNQGKINIIVTEEPIKETKGIEKIIVATKNEVSLGDGILINERICIISDIENKNNISFLTCNPLSNEFIIEKEIPAGTILDIHKSHKVE